MLRVRARERNDLVRGTQEKIGGVMMKIVDGEWMAKIGDQVVLSNQSNFMP
jgi:hypothetical protein